MNSDLDLQHSYHEWRRLAEAEGEAIRAGNWMLVFDCQNALRQLQPRIVRQTDAARREWAALGLDAEAMEYEMYRGTERFGTAKDLRRYQKRERWPSCQTCFA